MLESERYESPTLIKHIASLICSIMGGTYLGNMTVDVSKLRRLKIRVMVAETVYYFSILSLWAAFLMGTVHVWWVTVPILPVMFVRKRFLDARIVCPNCHWRLVDDEGDVYVGKSCGHCGIGFQ